MEEGGTQGNSSRPEKETAAGPGLSGWVSNLDEETRQILKRPRCTQHLSTPKTTNIRGINLSPSGKKAHSRSNIRKGWAARRKKSSLGDVKQIEMILPNIIRKQKQTEYKAKLEDTKKAFTSKPMISFRLISKVKAKASRAKRKRRLDVQKQKRKIFSNNKVSSFNSGESYLLMQFSS